jgi:hypothetical protein
MNTQKLTSLIFIGQLAVDVRNAELQVNHLKFEYHEKIRAFDGLAPGEIREMKLDPRNEACAEIIAYTRAEYAAVKAAKRKVYNIKRRMDTAIRNSYAVGGSNG